MSSLLIVRQAEVTERERRNALLLTASLSDAVAMGVRIPPLGIRVQAIQLSPYRTGLAGQYLQRLPASPAFPTCSFPLRFSPSGQSDGPEVFLRTSLDCVKDSASRSAAHAFPATGSPAASLPPSGSPLNLSSSFDFSFTARRFRRLHLPF
jgi:hypothetical protein